MNPTQINALNKLYNPPLSIFDKMLPFVIIFMVGCFTIVYMIKIDLSTSKLDWEKNKCIPKYLFVSGLSKKEKGLGVLASTHKNFKDCIRDYLNNDKLNPYVKPPEKEAKHHKHALKFRV